MSAKSDRVTAGRVRSNSREAVPPAASPSPPPPAPTTPGPGGTPPGGLLDPPRPGQEKPGPDVLLPRHVASGQAEHDRERPEVEDLRAGLQADRGSPHVQFHGAGR